MDNGGFLMTLHKRVNLLMVDKLVIFLIFQEKLKKTL